MADAAITLPLAIAMAACTSLLTIGGAWAVMRTRIADTRDVLKQHDTDLREAFRRLSALERDVVTRENLAEFRKEIISEIHSLRDLIERVRAPRSRNTE